MRKFLAFFFFLSFSNAFFAQNIRNEKFGNIKTEDFNPIADIIEKDAAAIVLSDVGSTEFEGNNNGRFTVIFKRHKKILLRKRTAFDEGTLKIYLWQFSAANEEKLEDLLAATYNLVNGKIVATKLVKNDIIKDKVSKNLYVRKFTLPDLQENCIIEFQYTIKSPYDTKLQSWYFQDQYPTLWSEYQVTIPPMYNYAVVNKGVYKSLEVDSSKLVYKNYTIIAPVSSTYGRSEIYETSGDAKWKLWAMKNVPAYKVQSFVANPLDNIAMYEFQLHSIKYSDENVVRRIRSWYETASSLLRDESFGTILDKEKNAWIEKEVTALTGNKEGVEAANIIFQYVRDNFNCIDDDGIFLSDDPMKTFKNKKGNIADINLLLTAMLAAKGYIAEPVILSTRGSGKISEASAILNEFNYLICRMKVDTTTYFLDAGESDNGFGMLPAKCYNGFGRVIAQIPLLIDLSANRNIESKLTSIFIANNDSGKIEASFSSTLGYDESRQLRKKLIKTPVTNFFKDITKDYTFSPTISNTEIDNIKNYNLPVTVKYDMNFTLGDDDIIYFNPLLSEATKENIFKAEKRLFKVEMPFAISETYILNMEVPKGYVVDEMPKSIRSKYNENEGLFEYLAINNDGQIQLQCKFQLYKANFDVEDYESLREFFGLMVKKQSEQIVFKKVKK